MLDRPLVAIMNTTIETIELLQDVLADEGFATVSAYIVDFKRGAQDLHTFFATHEPQAVVYDIALPYIENWTFFRDHVLAMGFLPKERFVLTTTNRSVLDVLVGPTNSIEMIGRPFDLDSIVSAVRKAIEHDQ